jgi:hypothetical protein
MASVGRLPSGDISVLSTHDCKVGGTIFIFALYSLYVCGIRGIYVCGIRGMYVLHGTVADVLQLTLKRGPGAPGPGPQDAVPGAPASLCDRPWGHHA